MRNFGPLMREQKLNEAEALLDRALSLVGEGGLNEEGSEN
jgi:hypothetical protein